MKFPRGKRRKGLKVNRNKLLVLNISRAAITEDQKSNIHKKSNTQEKKQTR